MSFDFRMTGGSFVLGSNGDIETVENIDKLSQDVIRIIATAVGENRLHSWYGTTIQDRVVGSGIERSLIKEEIENSVRFALQNLKSIQEQSERAGLVLSPREAISRIETVTALDTTDSRQIIVMISIRTRSGNRLQEQLSLNI